MHARVEMRLILEQDGNIEIQLHGFSDASDLVMQAYSACVYVKRESELQLFCFVRNLE